MTTTKLLQSINRAFQWMEGLQFQNWEDLENHLSQEDDFQFSRFLTFALGCELSRKRSYGCVSFWTQGSHRDMDYGTFLISTAVFYRFFGAEDLSSIEDFWTLKKLGQELEEEMFQSTGGINTQKGLLFLLMYMGNLYQRGLPLRQYSGEIQRLSREIIPPENTKGSFIGKNYPVRTIVDEAREGFPNLFHRYLPFFEKHKSLDQLTIEIFRHTDDTTTIYRSGFQRYMEYKAMALEEEGDRQHLDFLLVRENSTTGGVADLLSITILLYLIQCREAGDFSTLRQIKR